MSFGLGTEASRLVCNIQRATPRGLNSLRSNNKNKANLSVLRCRIVSVDEWRRHQGRRQGLALLTPGPVRIYKTAKLRCTHYTVAITFSFVRALCKNEDIALLTHHNIALRRISLVYNPCPTPQTRSARYPALSTMTSLACSKRIAIVS